ncbi:MAG TPA: hypothetical protein VD768_07855 [Sphingomicrobium sp.]|nr:hypothetical protein [Sphingomicrobium sp.]
MNPFEMVVLIVAIVMIASVLKTRGHGQQRMRGRDRSDDSETLRLREEVKELKARIHVLERIATDRENSLARQIDELRDR